ncbi:Protein of unknown function [Albimonas donghaensis]|uniref:DUF2924 domain-containing protein n=1 Tax=Albimonas donghaensis TaxID=356660 RepID=A0A1H3G6I3_9RHOB|nr:DUF2924 domain-containing protein [Albimonas donghaensis]SDX98886.1 Protein of unknown function [Albimonas donghaensis]
MRPERTAKRGGGSTASRLAAELERLGGLDAAALRLVWAERTGAAAPASAGGRLMRLALAHAAQAEALGGEPARLANAWRRIETARASGASAPAALQAGGGTAPTQATPAGARLIKTWRGETHEVLTTADGVEWKGRRYASLSAVARAITGTRRNGPAFFGLREAAGR